MKSPDIVSTITDSKSNVTYDFFAYRKLTYNEMVISVRNFHAQNKQLKVKAGQRISIQSIIGFDGL